MDMNPLRPIDIRNAEMNVGRFEIDNEPSAKISDRCNNLVTHTTTVAVQSVQVCDTLNIINSLALSLQSL